MIDLTLKKMLLSNDSEMQLDISLKIEKGQLVTLFGESGSGKTSTLRLISGLLKPDAGSLAVNGQCWFDAAKNINLAPGKRKIGYVFQDYALFPNMTVRENIAFAHPKQNVQGNLDDLITMMDLRKLCDRKPDQLSGGQKQRVALARALAMKPEILLLDEPLSALDQRMRERLQAYILQIHQKYRLTTILVSHDVGEILKLSDKVIELKDGNIIRECSPHELFGTGMTSAKFQFTGEIIQIHQEDIVDIINIKVGNDVVKIVSDKQETIKLQKGDKVLVGSKAFNPIVKKL